MTALLNERKRYATNGQGFLLIINYTYDREGCEYDKKKLINFFGRLNYRIAFFQNLQKRQLLDGLRALPDILDRGEYYCFVCVIMGHGNKKGIMTADTNELKIIGIKKILDIFDNRRLKTFAGKYMHLNELQYKLDDAGKKENSNANASTCTKDATNTSESNEMEILPPSGSDMVTFYSTVKGFVSKRYPDGGTVFIQNVLRTFEQHHCLLDVETMMKMASRRIQRTHRQVPLFCTTLSRKFHFIYCPRW
ncbi:hypothetical protein DPMN_163696 [Dreissena polymorpha]|uniref:Caspase family p20 domain-containing protein n=1 Tax=Dreissena polymorpha TaxID=45954 RepID=A0A9D4ETV4_DREPO|nr:hypothetical protein DPMN_163696 [Dreissena polymorpha]